jgi:hypothetical protein
MISNESKTAPQANGNGHGGQDTMADIQITNFTVHGNSRLYKKITQIFNIRLQISDSQQVLMYQAPMP